VNDKVTKQDIIVFVCIFLAMIGTLIYGFFFAGAGKVDNCWDKYSTEAEALLNCEGENK
jgi:hypothetical protein